LFDVGGVLGSDGWDRYQRRAAAAHFGIRHEDFEERHRDLVGAWERGRITIRDYLDFVVFDHPRDFSPEEFRSYMFAQSVPDPDALAVVRELHGRGTVRLMTLDNESRELHEHRVERFGLRECF